MLLRSYSFMPREIDIKLHYEVWEEIQNLKWYFVKFARVNHSEAMQRTFLHTIMHFNEDKGNLSAYVKKLAREITKENSRLVLVDFLDQTLSSDDDDFGEYKSTVDVGNITDFSNQLINDMFMSESKRGEIVNLALEFMDKFVLLCKALIKHDTSTNYYPEIFIKSCLAINQKCSNFNELCLEIYREYKDDFKWFLEIREGSDEWKEPDFSMIEQSQSKRIQFVNISGEPVEDADIEKYYLSGKLGSGQNKKRIIKVRYYELWEYFCDLLDDLETNSIKFVIDNSYICRTFGGSLSVLNPDIFNMYEVVKMEILTNILLDTYGRVLNVGSENIYLLCNAEFNKTSLDRKVNDYSFSLKYEDITETLL